MRFGEEEDEYKGKRVHEGKVVFENM